MTRIERIRNMTTKEIAIAIISYSITDEYCKSDCGQEEDCPHELKCCVKWLESEEI